MINSTIGEVGSTGGGSIVTAILAVVTWMDVWDLRRFNGGVGSSATDVNSRGPMELSSIGIKGVVSVPGWLRNVRRIGSERRSAGVASSSVFGRVEIDDTRGY